MKSKTRILTAFILNMFFAIFEFCGGMFSGSIAIMSDAIHDFGDAISIGISFFMEKLSDKSANEKYTYGYRRYSVLGGLITTAILLTGSILVIISSAKRLMNPTPINYDSMIIFAIIGCIINFIAAKLTHHGHSINQKAVSLHMLEDMLGWIIVLVGSIVMKFTDISIIDPMMSIALAIFIAYHAMKNVLEITSIFLMKTPKDIEFNHIKLQLEKIPEVKGFHHFHIWSLDGESNMATIHIVAKYNAELKERVKDIFADNNIEHTTIEFEEEDEHCKEYTCNIKHNEHEHHHH